LLIISNAKLVCLINIKLILYLNIFNYLATQKFKRTLLFKSSQKLNILIYKKYLNYLFICLIYYLFD
jgi:hypothetical protein